MGVETGPYRNGEVRCSPQGLSNLIPHPSAVKWPQRGLGFSNSTFRTWVGAKCSMLGSKGTPYLQG